MADLHLLQLCCALLATKIGETEDCKILDVVPDKTLDPLLTHLTDMYCLQLLLLNEVN